MSSKKNRLKRVKGDTGKRIKPTLDTTRYDEIDYPVFCLKNLQKDYSIQNLNKDHKSALMVRLHQLSQKKWVEIQHAHRHGFGSEKISQNSIHPGLPTIVTPDVTLLSLRYLGKHPFVGFRSGCIFHLLFVDHNFSVYDHG